MTGQRTTLSIRSEKPNLLDPGVVPGRSGEIAKNIFEGQRELDFVLFRVEVFRHVQVRNRVRMADGHQSSVAGDVDDEEAFAREGTVEDAPDLSTEPERNQHVHIIPVSSRRENVISFDVEIFDASRVNQNRSVPEQVVGVDDGAETVRFEPLHGQSVAHVVHFDPMVRFDVALDLFERGSEILSHPDFVDRLGFVQDCEH